MWLTQPALVRLPYSKLAAVSQKLWDQWTRARGMLSLATDVLKCFVFLSAFEYLGAI